ncbi:MAG: sialidase family protein [Planctomycetia bacterium]|nr:sialidase family protein [Planctomycetia bacterium]
MSKKIVSLCLALSCCLPLAWGEESVNNEPPIMPKDLVCSITTGENNPRNSEGGFVKLKNGDIFYVYTHFTGNDSNDHAPSYLAARRSSDNGTTWTDADEIALDNEGKGNTMSVSLLRLANDEIAMFYLVREHPGDCRPYMRISKDECQTWGDRILCFPDESYSGVNNDRVIQLGNGKLIMPIGRHKFLGPDEYNFEWTADVFCMISDDNGRTWAMGDLVDNPDKVMYQEPGVVELADGRLLMNIRTGSGSQYFAWSEDEGQHWTTPVPSCLDSPVSPAVIKRIPGRDELLAVWNPLLPDRSRTAMDIGILSPDGQTLKVRKRLEPIDSDKNFQYPAVLFLNDSEFLVSYFNWKVSNYIYKLNIIDLLDE